MNVTVKSMHVIRKQVLQDLDSDIAESCLCVPYPLFLLLPVSNTLPTPIAPHPLEFPARPNQLLMNTWCLEPFGALGRSCEAP